MSHHSFLTIDYHYQLSLSTITINYQLSICFIPIDSGIASRWHRIATRDFGMWICYK